MKYDKSDVEWHICIQGMQGMHMSAFWDYFWKTEGKLCKNQQPIQNNTKNIYAPHKKTNSIWPISTER